MDNFTSLENFKVTFFGLSGWWQGGLQFLRLSMLCSVTDSTSFVAYTLHMLDAGAGAWFAPEGAKKSGPRKTADISVFNTSITIS
jgi:hypothetical protein